MADSETNPQPEPEAAPQPEPFPNARPDVLDKVLEWAAVMWLRDNDPKDQHLFSTLAEEAFDRAVDATSTTE